MFETAQEKKMKILLILSLAVIIAACGSGKDDNQRQENKPFPNYYYRQLFPDAET